MIQVTKALNSKLDQNSSLMNQKSKLDAQGGEYLRIH